MAACVVSSKYLCFFTIMCVYVIEWHTHLIIIYRHKSKYNAVIWEMFVARIFAVAKEYKN